jgi:hypothetical protein
MRARDAQRAATSPDCPQYQGVWDHALSGFPSIDVPRRVVRPHEVAAAESVPTDWCRVASAENAHPEEKCPQKVLALFMRDLRAVCPRYLGDVREAEAPAYVLPVLGNSTPAMQSIAME